MLAVIDFETTGLTLHPDAPLSKQPKSIEFGGVLLDSETGEVKTELSLLIHPGEEITAEITKITGITNDQLAGALPFSEQLPVLREFFAQAAWVFAHNLLFDKAILMFELQRLGITDFPWPTREMCTVGLYRDQYGHNPRLVELYEDVIGVPLQQTHRALGDVHALVEILQKVKIWTVL